MAGSSDFGAARIAELDRGDMLGAIAGLPRQLAEGYAVARAGLRGVFGEAGAAAPAPPARPAGLVVCGMGGSAIGADLVLACLPDAARPGRRGTRLRAARLGRPRHAGRRHQLLGRHRGDARVRRRTPWSVAARPSASPPEAPWPHSPASAACPCSACPRGGQPRASLGYLAMPLLATLEAAGLCADASADVDETVAVLRAGNEALGAAGGRGVDAAKRLAERLHEKQAVVYGAGLTVPAARRWKGQVNENAKAPAFWNEFPELDHNEIMGWTSLPHVAAATLAVFLDDAKGDARLLRRAALTAAALEARGVAVERVQSRGASRLARLFSLVQLGDYASFYLALLYGVDPTPVGAIEEFKAKLAGGAGA